MLEKRIDILKSRPYFGGVENSRQIRALNEIKLYQNLILFNVYVGASSLFHVVSCPVQLNGSWIASFEEVGTCGRTSCAKRIDLSIVSVIPYNNGNWESENCLLRTNIRSLHKIYVEINRYQPQYY